MLGSILLQPQMLQRMGGRSAGDDLVDEVVAIGQMLALNPRAAEAVGPAFAAAGIAMSEALLERLKTRLPQALAELRTLADPVLASLSGFSGLQAPESAADLLTVMADASTRLGGVLDLLSDEQIRAFVRRVGAILGDTLGLSQQGFRDDLVKMLGDARHALREGNAALPAEAAAIREAMACLLARLELELFPQMPVLDLGLDRLADLLIGLLRRTPVPAVLAKSECLLGKLKAALLALAEVARALAALPGLSAGGVAGGGARPNRRRTRRLVASRRAVARAARSVAFAGDEPSAPTTPTPPRSDDGTYCWYASWLYATRRQGFGEGNGFFTEAENHWGRAILQTFTPGFPEDEVWHSKDKRKLVLRRRGIARDELLFQADEPFEWYEAPQFADEPRHEHFRVHPIGAAFLEKWTQASSVLAHSVAGLWHAILMGMSPKEYANNINGWLYHWADASARGIGGAPMMSLISRAGGLGTFWTWVVSAIAPATIFVLCSLEGQHTEETDGMLKFRQWALIMIADLFNAIKVSAVTGGVHDFFLSLFTLINYSGPGVPPPLTDDDRPKNWDMADPVIAVVNLLVGMGYTALISRDDYGIPFDNDGKFKASPLIFPLAIPGALLVGAFGNMLGTFTAWAICRTTTPTQLGKKMGLGALFATLTFVISFYNAKEGDTDGGHYNPRKDPEDKAYAPPRKDFVGYPDKATTPYRLPYAQGVALFVPQANLGIVSHSRFNGSPQIYAYDFGHDFHQEILAVRDGTIVDFFDWIPDNINPDDTQSATAKGEANTLMPSTEEDDPDNPGSKKTVKWRGDAPGWNFICVRHDTPVEGHDRDQGGDAVTTYAVYGHGATGGVRDLWKRRYGLDPEQILGRKVLRGHPLMAAGSTGNSMHAHLHLHIKRGPAVADATGQLPHPLVSPGDLKDYTLPFVFGDAPGDGVLHNLTWYESGNPLVTSVPAP